MFKNSELKRNGLDRIKAKIESGERLTIEDGERLYSCPDPLLVGSLAHMVRKKKHGLNTSYVLNQQINYTNICINHCLFCSYFREKGQEGAFELSLEEIEQKVSSHLNEPITEIHIVGGCHPNLPLDYYLKMLGLIKRLRPEVTLKCFTPVEIAHLAKIENLTIEVTLKRLKEAGLDMLPGGGAEIFAPAIRNKICPNKISGDKWLEVSAKAHQIGIKTNCTMLFGHLESVSDRLEHLDQLRSQQDKSKGFVCFIPLPFLTQGNRLIDVKPQAGLNQLKTIAICRLMLDNIDHIKSYWIMLGLKQAQAALYFGADDLDGTVVEEKIGHMAGADSPQILSRQELEEMIQGCGLNPVERNASFKYLQTKS